MVERPQKVPPTAKNLYERDRAGCHGRDPLASPPEFPALTSMSRKYNEAEMQSLIRGRRWSKTGLSHAQQRGQAPVSRVTC